MEEKSRSEYARTRERDEYGRFLSDSDDVAAFYYTPFKVVYEPRRNGPKHVLVKQHRLYWWQKAYLIAIPPLIAYAAWWIVTL